MAERKRIGLICNIQKNWIAGTYYLLNLVHALNTLDDKSKPYIIVISTDKREYVLIAGETAYPYLSFKKANYGYSIPERIINKIWRSIFSKQLVVNRLKEEVDVLFPNPPSNSFFGEIENQKKLYWIPDFQEDHYPEFFTKDMVKARKSYQQRLASEYNKIVFSSQDAQNDFWRLYPNAKAKTYVLHFAVTHPAYKHIEIKSLLRRYKLPEAYFISPNQLWVHKNHKIIIEAVDHLSKEGIKVTVVFTGKEHDYRYPNYAIELKRMATEKLQEDAIRFLGFIDRNEQLQLMDNAIAVIQPSLFEGWSTVIEDAKALGKLILASDIGVHREQIKNGGVFFDPHKPEALALLLQKTLFNPPFTEKNSYENEVDRFGREFMKIVSDR